MFFAFLSFLFCDCALFCHILRAKKIKRFSTIDIICEVIDTNECFVIKCEEANNNENDEISMTFNENNNKVV